jgi:hypothetical protein
MIFNSSVKAKLLKQIFSHIVFSNDFSSLGALEVNRIFSKTSALISIPIKSKIV